MKGKSGLTSGLLHITSGPRAQVLSHLRPGRIVLCSVTIILHDSRVDDTLPTCMFPVAVPCILLSCFEGKFKENDSHLLKLYVSGIVLSDFHITQTTPVPLESQQRLFLFVQSGLLCGTGTEIQGVFTKGI